MQWSAEALATTALPRKAAATKTPQLRGPLCWGRRHAIAWIGPARGRRRPAPAHHPRCHCGWYPGSRHTRSGGPRRIARECRGVRRGHASRALSSGGGLPPGWPARAECRQHPIRVAFASPWPLQGRQLPPWYSVAFLARVRGKISGRGVVVAIRDPCPSCRSRRQLPLPRRCARQQPMQRPGQSVLLPRQAAPAAPRRSLAGREVRLGWWSRCPCWENRALAREPPAPRRRGARHESLSRLTPPRHIQQIGRR